MRIGLAIWNGRISPVFDVSGRLRLLDVEGGRVVRRSEAPLEATDPWQRADEVRRLGVQTLVCGAISIPLASALAARQIQVIPFVSGPEEDAAWACLSGRPHHVAFSMPGCGRGRGRGGGGGAGRGRQRRGLARG